jgi:hypothetical protein
VTEPPVEVEAPPDLVLVVLVAVDWLSVWSDFVAAWVACVERFAS